MPPLLNFSWAERKIVGENYHICDIKESVQIKMGTLTCPQLLEWAPSVIGVTPFNFILISIKLVLMNDCQ